MGEAVERLRQRVGLTRVYVGPHERITKDGTVHVDGYWREVPEGSPEIVTPAAPDPKPIYDKGGYRAKDRWGDWPTIPEGEGQLRFYGNQESKSYFTKTDIDPGEDVRSLVTPSGQEVGPTTGFVTEYDRTYLGALKVWAEDHGMTQKQLLDKMEATAQKWYDTHFPCITVPSSVVPELFKKGGHFKNQFEAKSSNGMYKPGTRKDIESELFGYPLLKVKAKDRPVYGYVGDGEGNGKSGGVDQYGDVFFILKDDIRDRTTVTQEDSADRNLVPEPMRHVSWRQDVVNPGSSHAYRDDSPPGKRLTTISGREYDSEDMPDSDLTEDQLVQWYQDHFPQQETVDWTTFSPEDACAQYVEAQYHGGVSLDDVQKVVFLHKNSADAYRKQFEERGIEVVVKSLVGYTPSFSLDYSDPRIPKEILEQYKRRKFGGQSIYDSGELFDEQVDADGVRSWRVHFPEQPSTYDDGSQWGADYTIPAWDLPGRVREGEDVFKGDPFAEDDSKAYGEM